jgi:hypothetical protein
MLTIGTFLGLCGQMNRGAGTGLGSKETWSLITIIVYSFVIHSRMISGMKDIYTFNLLSLFAFASVLMTYFGVNYSLPDFTHMPEAIRCRFPFSYMRPLLFLCRWRFWDG